MENILKIETNYERDGRDFALILRNGAGRAQYPKMSGGPRTASAIILTVRPKRIAYTTGAM
jgi:hypothetical protein